MSLATTLRRAKALAAVLLVPAGAFAQAEVEPGGPTPATLSVSPEEITLTAGEVAHIDATVLDADGNEMEADILYLPLYGQYWNLEERTWGFNIFTVSADGRISTMRPGRFAVMVRVARPAPDPSGPDAVVEDRLQQRVPLTILPRPSASLTVSASGPFYAGTEVAVLAEARDETGAVVADAVVDWRTSDGSVALPVGRPAAIDGAGARAVLALGAPGRVTVTATAGGATAEMLLDVAPNPAAGIHLTPDRSTVRTGDVTHLTARVTDAEGRRLDDVPVGFTRLRRHRRPEPAAALPRGWSPRTAGSWRISPGSIPSSPAAARCRPPPSSGSSSAGSGAPSSWSGTAACRTAPPPTSGCGRPPTGATTP